MKWSIFIWLLISSFCFQNLEAQKGYKKDSLQIKIYTSIKYINSVAKEIKVRKIFCDYCNELQLEALKEEGIRRSYLVRNNKENKVVNGERKLSLYIRVSKKDFAAIKKEIKNKE